MSLEKRLIERTSHLLSSVLGTKSINQNIRELIIYIINPILIRFFLLSHLFLSRNPRKRLATSYPRQFIAKIRPIRDSSIPKYFKR
jgi:hydrogenase-4 membrane subunit HyfE